MSFVVRELTASAPGGVAVLELDGPGALPALHALAGRELEPGDLKLVRLRAGQELLDEGLCWVETERRVELHLHGSVPVVERVTAELLARGGRAPAPARNLEERAAEALARADSEAAARILLDQVEGALRRALEALLDPHRAREDDAARLRQLLARGRVMRHLATPPRVVLGGPVNAGKSTLFNVLVGHERVVVHDEQGTTRDAVRERIRIGAYAVDLVDTAGERELGTEPGASESGPVRVERAGQLLGRELRRSADLVLWLDPFNGEVRTPPRIVAELAAGAAAGVGLTRVLRSRSHESHTPSSAGGDPGAPRIAALERPEEARRVVARLLHEALRLPEQPWEAGAAVPFEPEQWTLLEALESERVDGPGWRTALESLLAR